LRRDAGEGGLGPLVRVLGLAVVVVVIREVGVRASGASFELLFFGIRREFGTVYFKEGGGAMNDRDEK
jgi:hypothetical protein